jgi:hypothetical protein
VRRAPLRAGTSCVAGVLSTVDLGRPFFFYPNFSIALNTFSPSTIGFFCSRGICLPAPTFFSTFAERFDLRAYVYTFELEQHFSLISLDPTHACTHRCTGLFKCRNTVRVVASVPSDAQRMSKMTMNENAADVVESELHINLNDI